MEKKTAKITIRVSDAFKEKFVQHCLKQERSESWLGAKYLRAGMEAEKSVAKKPHRP